MSAAPNGATGLDVRWRRPTGAGLSYNVYVSTTPSFTPASRLSVLRRDHDWVFTFDGAATLAVECLWPVMLTRYGPNAYSLEEAREHFREYLTSYGPKHEISPQFQRDGVRFVDELELSPANLEAKRRKIAALERYMA